MNGANKAARASKEWQTVYKFIHRWKTLSIKEVYSPVSGVFEERIVMPGDIIPYKIILRTKMNWTTLWRSTLQKQKVMVHLNCTIE